MSNADKPAYPDPMRGADQSVINQTPHELPTGLSKRELIAAMCLQGLLANPEIINILRKSGLHHDKHVEYVAVSAVEQADALIEELQKEKK